MSSWTAQRVLDAAAAMEFVPEGATEVRTDDYRLLRHADWALSPSLGAAQVTWSRTTRPPGEVIDEVAALVRGWGLPGGVAVELVGDERTFRAASTVSVQGWESIEPDQAQIARQLSQTLRDLETWSSFRVVAFADGEPVSVGGCTLTAEVAQEKIALLWGAITLPAARGHGSYRALLAERLRLAREHGATLAMAKGRTLPSGPILLRAGFTDYGEERCYWLPVV